MRTQMSVNGHHGKVEKQIHLRPYATRQDSGGHPFSNMPDHWVQKRLKYCATLKNDKVEASVVRLPYLGLENVESGTGRVVSMSEASKVDGIANRFCRDNVLFGKLRPYLAKVIHACFTGVCTSELLVLEPRLVTSRFLFYSMLNSQFVDVVGSSTYGAKMPRASWDFIGNLPVPVPPLPEQQSIANFLDRETAKIDALIAKNRWLIELLREKREAVISDCVAGGLSDVRRTTASGVEWLGRIPSHWKIRKLKQCVLPGTSVSYGIVQPGIHVDEGVPFVQTTNMTTGRLSIQDLPRTSPEIAAKYPRSCISDNDVILCIRASIGDAYVVPHELRGSNLSRGVARIVLKSELDPRFVVSFLRSRQANEYWRLVCQGSTFNEVSIASVKEIPIPVPPVSEQDDILSTLDSRLQRIDRLLHRVSDAQRLLQEYRSALISAAVTGKIDVRNQ